MRCGFRREVFYPLGYPLQIESESSIVFAICGDAWGHWPRLFDTDPIRLRVWVTEGEVASRPTFLVRRGTVAYVAGRKNCGGFRPEARVAWLRTSHQTLRGTVFFRYHFLEALVLTLLDTVAFTPIHAACIARANRAVLLCGDSGAGKSSLAYSAVCRGWTFLSDDAVHVVRDGTGTLVGNPYKLHLRPEAQTLFPELAGRAPQLLPNGKTAIEITTAALDTQLMCQQRHVCVFLHRRPGRADIRRHRINDALAYFRKYAWWLPRIRTTSDFRSVLAGGCWSLEYESGIDALDALDSLLKTTTA